MPSLDNQTLNALNRALNAFNKEQLYDVIKEIVMKDLEEYNSTVIRVIEDLKQHPYDLLDAPRLREAIQRICQQGDADLVRTVTEKVDSLIRVNGLDLDLVTPSTPNTTTSTSGEHAGQGAGNTQQAPFPYTDDELAQLIRDAEEVIDNAGMHEMFQISSQMDGISPEAERAEAIIGYCLQDAILRKKKLPDDFEDTIRERTTRAYTPNHE